MEMKKEMEMEMEMERSNGYGPAMDRNGEIKFK